MKALTNDRYPGSYVHARILSGCSTRRKALLMLLLSGGMASPAYAQAETEQTAAPAEAEEEEETITVEGRRVGGYREDMTSSAMRIPVDIENLPLSVQVIPSEVLNDQAVQTLADAYRNVSSTSRVNTGDYGANRETAIIRGFTALDLNRNGFPTRAIGSIDFAGIETVDVLKGPASFTYGQVEPGGLVNYTTKRPLDTFFAAAQAFIGSHEYLRGTIDVTGPLNEEGTILARAIGAVTDQDSYRDFVNMDQLYGGASITFKPSAGVSINLEANYSERSQPWDAGVPFSTTGKPIAPISNYYGDPSLRGTDIRDTFLSADATFNISEALTLRAAFMHHRFLHDYEAFRPRSVYVTAQGEQRMRRRYTTLDFKSVENQAVGILTWKGATGPFEHTLSTMVDYRNVDIFGETFRENGAVDTSISILNPTYGFDTSTLTLNGFTTDVVSREVGVSINDLISFWNDRAHILLGVRFDDVRINGVLTYADPPIVHDPLKFDDVSFSGGLLVEAIENVSLYASYAESFNGRETIYYFDEQGDVLPPMTGKQYEVGARLELFDEALRINAAAFEIRRRNEPFYFYNEDTGAYFYEAAGETRSRGFEIDIVGRVTSNFNLIGSYSHIDVEAVTDVPSFIPTGTQLRNVPRHAASLWANYEVPLNLGGRDGELGLGAGIFYVGTRNGDNSGSFKLPSYTQVDAGISYNTKLRSGSELQFRLNVSNLFNEDIYLAAGSRAAVSTYGPRSVIGSVGISF